MSRPLPRITSETRFFWEGCNEKLLRYQTCGQCGAVQVIPRSLCAACQHDVLLWKESSGRGSILSFTVVHRAPTPAFRDEVPYVIAVLDMAEGFRLMVNVKDGAKQELAIGQGVRIGYSDVDGVLLPHAEVDA